MTAERFRALLAGGSIAALAAVAISFGGGAPQAAVAADPGAAEQAEVLATVEAPTELDASTDYAPGREAATRAGKLAGQVPLPPGEAFNDIQWNNGSLSEADIQALLEMNAACKWWMADADAPSKETSEVVEAIPSWPTMREGDRHALAVAFTASGDPERAAPMLAACRRELR